MIKEIYRLRLIFLLAFVAVLMGLTRWKYRNYNWEEVMPMAQISPTPQILPTPTYAQEVIYPLIKQLPYQGKDFVVDSYLGPMMLNVITTGNVKTATKEIYAWMEKNKVATESHKLVFSDK